MNQEIDVNQVVAKLQARLGEAFTVIALLESRLEASLEELAKYEKDSSAQL